MVVNGLPKNDYSSCVQSYENFTYEQNYTYCNSTWDEYLCWPPTKGGENSTQYCPDNLAFNTSQTTYRTCTPEGRWEGKFPNDTSMANGYTHYKLCLTEALRKLYEVVDKGGKAQAKFTIARNTRFLEFVGLAVSLVSLLISLFVFYYYRSLRNNRTRIHKNLFIAMVIQVLIRLILYIDQAIVREQGQQHGIDNTIYLCEAGYVLLEYARTAMFMWMFIEGLYLHNMLTVTVFQANSYYIVYYFIGWGGPILMTMAWAITMGLQYKEKCWLGYNLTSYYWIVEGPRLGVIVLNMIFLFNIIRILIVKLQQSHTSEIEQVRTAIRATLFLLPLLGIANLVVMTDSHIDGEPWQFALWSYSTHFLTSFQGFFIALLYCFLNGEVRTAIKASTFMTEVFVKYQTCHPHRRDSFSGNTRTTET